MEGIVHRLKSIKKNKTLSFIYVANLLLSFHYFLVIYINSSFLGGFFTEETVSLLFIAGAFGSLTLFFLAPRMIRDMGMYRYLAVMTIIECISVFGLAGASSGIAILLLFVIHNSVVPTIIYALDIFLETSTEKESHTGQLRGAFLTISNATLVLSPLITGIILKSFSFQYTYFISALFCIPLLIVAYSYFQDVTPSAPPHVNIRHSFKYIWEKKDVRFTIISQFILQFFYVWMVVYLPIYLINVIGFSWTELGTLFTIMLLPFILFEIPIGMLADRKLGEKELMIFGFLLTACIAASFSLPTKPDFTLWAILLFMSRVGASIVEVTIESFFFKHVKGSDTDIISIFRMATQVAYIIAPTLAIFTFSLFTFGQNFWILGCVTFLGSISALQIKDTL
jgi:MFS family permease